MKATIHIDNKGLIAEARQQPSPNCDSRPDDCPASLLVIHGISLPPGKFGGPYIDQLFTNQLNPAEHPYFAEIEHLRVSSHLLIRRDGELVQYVPLNHRAWHAGQSSFDGVERCNDFSIGIELEGTDSDPYTDAQYVTLGLVSLAIMQHYPDINLQRITGHCHIAPERKTDPGPCFDWPRYHDLLQS